MRKTGMSKARFYDRLHKVTVSGLMGLTLVGCSLLVYRFYRYFTVVRPRQLEQKRLLAEEGMTQEQLEREAELLRRQREAETLKS
ncbi:uncharacterized protein LOC135461392 isoform X2 [Liolophura sinensis]